MMLVMRRLGRRFVGRRFVGALVVVAGLAGHADADMITFERRPNGEVPTDNTRLANPYAIEGGGTVQFFFDANDNLVFDQGDSFPWFEEVGANAADGFFSEYYSRPGTNVFDRARPGYGAQLGRFFVRQPDGIGAVPAPFVILYDTDQVIREFSGEIWDIDGGPNNSEQWLVEVLDASGAVLKDAAGQDISQLSPLGNFGQGPNSLDSLPWNFAFRDLPDGVRAIRLTFTGTKTDGVGLAFNNFSAIRAVPEPSSVALLGLGALGLLAARRRGHRA